MSELTPITRKETFLAKAGGQNVVTPTPITREETFLQAIIDNGGGGGGTGGGVLYVSFQDPTAENPILNKTWQEIYDAATGGSVVIFRGTFETGPETQYAVEPLIALFNGDYDGTIIYGVSFTNYGPYNCGSPNGYPESNYTP